MNPIPILKIEDCFALSDGRVIVVPDFPTVDGLKAPKTLAALIKKSGGQTIPCTVELGLTHFNIPHSNDVNRRWRIVPELRGIKKSDVKSGDELCIFDADIASLLICATDHSEDDTRTPLA